MRGNLTNAHHELMDEYLGKLYDDVRSGTVSRDSFVGGTAHIMAALDIDNHGEAVTWFKNHVRGFDDASDASTEGGPDVEVPPSVSPSNPSSGSTPARPDWQRKLAEREREDAYRRNLDNPRQ